MRRMAAAAGLVGAIAALAIGSAPATAEPGHGAGQRAGASIVGGSTASIEELPWMAYVRYRGPAQGSACTGTVVAPRLVLTAGHCVVSEAGRLLSPGNFTVVTGVADLRRAEPANESQVTQVLVAPGFSATNLRHDASLLVLAAPVAQPPIVLAGAADSSLYAAGTQITIAGWGLTSGEARRGPDVLRRATTALQRAAYCARRVKPINPGYDSAAQFCAASSPKFRSSSCQGDSGGPGIAMRADGTPVQVGIVSFGIVGCDTRNPEVHTRVDGVSEWVGSWIAAIEQGAPAPTLFRPKLFRLPRLSKRQATILAIEGLYVDFRQRFLQGRFTEIDCRRVEREKFKCLVFWLHARSVYIGAITVFLSLPKEGSIANYRYRIKRYNAVCWAYSRRAAACPGKLFHR